MKTFSKRQIIIARIGLVILVIGWIPITAIIAIVADIHTPHWIKFLANLIVTVCTSIGLGVILGAVWRKSGGSIGRTTGVVALFLTVLYTYMRHIGPSRYDSPPMEINPENTFFTITWVGLGILSFFMFRSSEWLKQNQKI